jgi:hypothetical protein
MSLISARSISLDSTFKGQNVHFLINRILSVKSIFLHVTACFMAFYSYGDCGESYIQIKRAGWVLSYQRYVKGEKCQFEYPVKQKQNNKTKFFHRVTLSL